MAFLGEGDGGLSEPLSRILLSVLLYLSNEALHLSGTALSSS